MRLWCVSVSVAPMMWLLCAGCPETSEPVGAPPPRRARAATVPAELPAQEPRSVAAEEEPAPSEEPELVAPQ